MRRSTCKLLHATDIPRPTSHSGPLTVLCPQFDLLQGTAPGEAEGQGTSSLLDCIISRTPAERVRVLHQVAVSDRHSIHLLHPIAIDSDPATSGSFHLSSLKLKARKQGDCSHCLHPQTTIRQNGPSCHGDAEDLPHGEDRKCNGPFHSLAKGRVVRAPSKARGPWSPCVPQLR